VLFSRNYQSLGDGVVASRRTSGRRDPASVPYAYSTPDELLELGRTRRMRIAEITLANESVVHSPGEVRSLLLRIADVMRGSIERGLAADGPCRAVACAAHPRRRTRCGPAMPRRRSGARCSRRQSPRRMRRRACGRRASNGSAGPVAALLSHFRETPAIDREQGSVDFLLTAAAIGGLLRAAAWSGPLPGRGGRRGGDGRCRLRGRAGWYRRPRAVGGGARARAAPRLACDPRVRASSQPCIGRNAAAAERAVTATQRALSHPAPRQSLDALTER